MNDFLYCPPDVHEMIEEKDVFQAIYDFAYERYDDILDKFIKDHIEDFPEKDWELEPEQWHKNLMSFIMYEVELPGRNRTIAEEFASTSEEITEELRDKIMQMRNMIRSRFEVVSILDENNYEVKDPRTVSEYKILSKFPVEYEKGDMITGKIHPFGDTFQFQGIYFHTRKKPFPFLEFDDFMDLYQEREREELEDINLKADRSFSWILNKYPIHMVDGMCKRYRIKKRRKKEKIASLEDRIEEKIPDIVKGASEEMREVLKILIEKGGYAKISSLKDFEDDTRYMQEGENQTPIGKLREEGILFVGKMKVNGRRYRSAFIPVEFRDIIEDALIGGRSKEVDDGQSTIDRFL